MEWKMTSILLEFCTGSPSGLFQALRKWGRAKNVGAGGEKHAQLVFRSPPPPPPLLESPCQKECLLFVCHCYCLCSGSQIMKDRSTRRWRFFFTYSRYRWKFIKFQGQNNYLVLWRILSPEARLRIFFGPLRKTFLH